MWLDNLINAVSPGWGARRSRARSVITAYKYAEKSRTNSWRSEGRDPNSPVWAAGEALRYQGRAFDQDNDVAHHALNILVNKVIGRGLVPEPMVMDVNGSPLEDINKQIADLYEEWSERVDVGKRYDAAQAQRLEARTFFRDGEVFTKHLTGITPNLRHAGRIPYSLELIEPDLIPMEMNSDGVLQGIAINEWREAIAYFVRRRYDQGYYQAGYGRGLRAGEADTVRVEGDQMTHLALLDRIGQVRGVSIFATVIGRLGDIAELEESERIAARVAAAFSAVIVKGVADNYVTPEGGGPRNMKMAPGMIFDDLLPGERVESMNSTRPNTDVVSFNNGQMRRVAGGMNVGASTLMNMYDGSYSAQRQELVETDVAYKILSDYFILHAEKPKYRRFISMCIASNMIEGITAPNVDRATWAKAHWTPPAMPWVDPAKEMSGIKDELEMGLNSRISVQRRRGLNPRQVAHERALDAELDEIAGDSDPLVDEPTEPPAPAEPPVLRRVADE